MYKRQKETQLKWFARHFEIAERTGLPMFLHSRAAHEDFFRLLKAARGEGATATEATETTPMKKRKPPPCVVHSFDGTAAEAADLQDLEEADCMELGMKKIEIKRLKRSAQ